MKTKSNRRTAGNRGGFATLIFLVLMAVMASFVVSNAITLRSLKKELQLIEKRQMQVHVQHPAPAAEIGESDGTNPVD